MLPPNVLSQFCLWWTFGVSAVICHASDVLYKCQFALRVCVFGDVPKNTYGWLRDCIP